MNCVPYEAEIRSSLLLHLQDTGACAAAITALQHHTPKQPRPATEQSLSATAVVPDGGSGSGSGGGSSDTAPPVSAASAAPVAVAVPSVVGDDDEWEEG